jgi:ribose 5-phosphate isomerase
MGWADQNAVCDDEWATLPASRVLEKGVGVEKDGVVEPGLFIGMVDMCITAKQDGGRCRSAAASCVCPR